MVHVWIHVAILKFATLQCCIKNERNKNCETEEEESMRWVNGMKPSEALKLNRSNNLT